MPQSWDGAAIVHAVGVIMRRFEISQNGRSDEGWLNGLLADENEPRATFAIHEDGTKLTMVHTGIGNVHGVAMGSITHPRVVAMLQDTRIHFTILNMLSFDPARLHAVVALLLLLDTNGGVLTIPGTDLDLDRVAALLFMCMWTTANGHASLPFCAADSTSAYYHLFGMCTSSSKRFQQLERVVNPKQLTVHSDLGRVYSVRKVADLEDGGSLYLKVPSTNYDPDTLVKANFVRDFCTYCAAAAAPRIPKPALSVVDCKMNPHLVAFRPMYYRMGLQTAEQRVVWTMMLTFQRTDALPQDLVLAVLALAEEMCAFRTTDYDDQDSEDDTDWDDVESVDEEPNLY
jgi:hypothetical protein